MRKLIPLPLFAAIVAIGLSATTSTGVPTPTERPVKWEYAEIITRSSLAKDRGFGKGGDPANGFQPAQPAQPAANAIRFVTAQEEISAKNWEELAEKLKAPAPGKEAATASHKLCVFDRLGADGWELVGQQSGTTPTAAGTWMFKRRVP